MPHEFEIEPTLLVRESPSIALICDKIRLYIHKTKIADKNV